VLPKLIGEIITELVNGYLCWKIVRNVYTYQKKYVLIMSMHIIKLATICADTKAGDYEISLQVLFERQES
jgi:hypothetical protein